ncbi:MAG: tRNA uridine-5-carboxymethylaminomethyl(34) synthesis GTPase MnmE [Alphaproteobacteria bacterium]|nr:tRNA uridine-5-carboxymethylaminomethyl(34) synthesis GTPase MnmE [Alphaproteobacteria bacterium]
MDNQTIYALSTVQGRSGVAVIRISGPMALDTVKFLTNINPQTIKPRYAYFSPLHNSSGEVLDHALVLYFKAPHSFTGEDIVELQTHGSKAVISSVLSALSSLKGFRYASAGEFSKRAFLNHKMDLTQAEGLADLIDAETSEQQKFAIRQIEGNLKNLYESWREQLLKVLAHLEAYIDFPDEELPPELINNLENTVFKIISAIEYHLSGNNIGESMRDGFRVVILGAPNAGKSSLINALTSRDAVIVSDIAGTTRDAIDIHMDINGYPVIFTDTAGLRETGEEIERQGIAIAYRKASDSDLVINLFDGCENIHQPLENIDKTKIISVANKADKLSPQTISYLNSQGIITISAKYKQGLDTLLSAISDNIKQRVTDNSGLLITRHRYTEALKNTINHLKQFNLSKEIELAAEDIRLSARELGKITGFIEVDEILNKIFSSFCIGK